MAVGKKFGTFSTWLMYFLAYRIGLVLCSNRPFPSSPGICFKTRVGAQPLVWKSFFILMQIKLIFTTKVMHLASFREWGFLELVSGLFIWYAPGITLNSGDNHLTNDNKAMALSRELRKSWNHCQVWICANLSHNNLMPQFMGNFICHIIPENTLKILQSV